MNDNALTKQELRMLRWAVREAAAWRGTLVGNPDPVPLQDFDACIKIAKTAVKKLGILSSGGS